MHSRKQHPHPHCQRPPLSTDPLPLAYTLQTAATLHDQTQQLNTVTDSLNQIDFTMKKASKVITDIGRDLMTDK
jgi:hypothetical protein